MKGITIFMEGGGRGQGGRAKLRQGMDAFLGPLKQTARHRKMRWKLVCCGPRGEAYRRFRSAVLGSGPGDTAILLVDSEDRVDRSPRAHLSGRKEDKWDLRFTGDAYVHLMVQVMETWIVADPQALAEYYGQRFGKARLPKRADLEEVSKKQVIHALESASAPTGKGTYGKIAHASALLMRINPEKVKARCPHCRRLFEELSRLFEAA